MLTAALPAHRFLRVVANRIRAASGLMQREPSHTDDSSSRVGDACCMVHPRGMGLVHPWIAAFSKRRAQYCRKIRCVGECRSTRLHQRVPCQSVGATRDRLKGCFCSEVSASAELVFRARRPRSDTQPCGYGGGATGRALRQCTFLCLLRLPAARALPITIWRTDLHWIGHWTCPCCHPPPFGVSRCLY